MQKSFTFCDSICCCCLWWLNDEFRWWRDINHSHGINRFKTKVNAFHYRPLFAQGSFCCHAQSIAQILTLPPGNGWLNRTRLFKSFVTQAPGKSIREQTASHTPKHQANVPKLADKHWGEKFHAKSNREGKCVDSPRGRGKERETMNWETVAKTISSYWVPFEICGWETLIKTF